MQPHAISRKALQAAVQSRHVLLHQFVKLRVRRVLVKQDPFHREIGGVDLQDESRLDNPRILDAHLARDGIEIVLMRLVMRVQHRRRDNSRRGRIHEELGEPGFHRRRQPLVARDLRIDGGRIAILQLADRLGRVEHLAVVRDARQHPLRELRKLDELLAEPPLRYTAEAVHALRNIGLEADPRLLAVIGAVDADLGFLREHVRNARIRELIELGLVYGLALLLVDQQRPERLATRDAASVRRQDPVNTVLHPRASSAFALHGLYVVLVRLHGTWGESRLHWNGSGCDGWAARAESDGWSRAWHPGSCCAGTRGGKIKAVSCRSVRSRARTNARSRTACRRGGRPASPPPGSAGRARDWRPGRCRPDGATSCGPTSASAASPFFSCDPY